MVADGQLDVTCVAELFLFHTMKPALPETSCLVGGPAEIGVPIIIIQVVEFSSGRGGTKLERF